MSKSIEQYMENYIGMADPKAEHDEWLSSIITNVRIKRLTIIEMYAQGGKCDFCHQGYERSENASIVIGKQVSDTEIQYLSFMHPACFTYLSGIKLK